MSKAVLISIRPKWCELIASGEKSIEVRKTRPKIETPFKCYIYCTKPSFEYEDFIALDNGRFIYGGGKVIGEFICDKVFPITVEENGPFSEERGGGYSEDYSAKGFHDCLTDEEFDRYLGAKDGYGWHISNLVIYDEPMKLCDFKSYNTLIDFECGYPMPTHGIRRPPQSWMYVEELA